MTEPVIQRAHVPETYLRAAYMDLAYALGQFTEKELKDAGMTPKLRDAMEGYLVAYVVASINFDEEGDASGQ